MPHRKSSGSKSGQAVPGKSMGNYGKAKVASKTKARPVPPVMQAAENIPAILPEEELVECWMYPGEKIEKEVAFQNIRNDQCREKGLWCCVKS